MLLRLYEGPLHPSLIWHFRVAEEPWSLATRPQKGRRGISLTRPGNPFRVSLAMSIKAWQRAERVLRHHTPAGSWNTAIPLAWSPLNLTTKSKLALSSKDRNPCVLGHTPCTSPLAYDWLDRENRNNSAHPPTSRPCSPPVSPPPALPCIS